MGEGSTLKTYETPFGKIGGLTCWENYMPLTRFYMYSQGVDVIVSPMGEILAGPSRHEETILYAELELAKVHAARRMFDPVGHYQRPDVFRLGVDTRPRPSVVEFDAALDDENPWTSA